MDGSFDVRTSNPRLEALKIFIQYTAILPVDDSDWKDISAIAQFIEDGTIPTPEPKTGTGE